MFAEARPPVQQELSESPRLPVDYESLGSRARLAADRVVDERRRFEPWAWPQLRLRLLDHAVDSALLAALRR